jgi:hypothetical protein
MGSPDRFPRRRPVPWRLLDTEALVVDPKAGLLYPLNSVGARIWELADGTRSADAIADALVEEFDADETTIRADATRFLDDLARAGLISMERAPAAGA